MTPEAYIKVREDAAVWREVDGETVLLNLSSASYLGINASGSLLWSAIVEGATRSGLTDLLIERFGLDHQRATRDVDEFLETCRAHGLIE